MNPQICTVLLTVHLVAAPFLCSQQAQPSRDPAFQLQFEQGQTVLQAGKYDEAINAFKKANKLQKDSCAQCYLGMAVAYYHKEDLDKARENCDRALASAPDDTTRVVAHNLKGNVLLTFSETDPKKLVQADAEFRSAIELDPGKPALHLNLARVLLKQSKDDDAIDELKKCLTMNPNQSMAEQAKMLIADPRRGRMAFAPEFHFTTMQGQDVSLKQLAGRVVVLDFWATWCPPCRASVPELKELTKKYPNEKLALISISADTDEKAWQEFVAKKEMNWQQYRDVDSRIRESFGVQSFPTYLVIDREGIIRERIVGMNERDSIVHRLKSTLASLSELKDNKQD